MNDSTKTYWGRVGEKLKGLSKVVLNMSVPVAVEAGINKACSIINEKLHDMYRNTVVNSLITLILNVAGMLIVLLNPFGTVVSKYIAAGFFSGSVVFFAVRFIHYISEYGKITFDISKNIVTERSISKGIENYVLTEFLVISLAYTGINIVSEYLPALKQIPSLQKTIKIFINTFWKELAIFVSVMTVYSVSVYWIAKPILLRNMADLVWYEVYFYPLYHLLSLLK